jgi:hypothetical protein
MDPTVAVALIGVGGTGTVSILTQLIAAKREGNRQQNQLDHDRHMTDLVELRSLLDSAAVMTLEFMDKASNAFVALDLWHEAAAEDDEERAQSVRDARHDAWAAYRKTDAMFT